MYCKRCGKYSPSYAKVCVYCGCNEFVNNLKDTDDGGTAHSSYYCRDKFNIGIILAIFLGTIGLILGLFLYPSATYERETFLSGWTKTFVIALIVKVVLFVFTVGCSSLGALNFL